MHLCFMVFAMFSTIYYNIARKRDATASDVRQQETRRECLNYILRASAGRR